MYHQIYELGTFAPDDLMLSALAQALQEAQIQGKTLTLLNRIPRTMAQASAMLDRFGIYKVIAIMVSDKISLHNQENRSFCMLCNRAYSKIYTQCKPDIPDHCDICGGAWIIRADDHGDAAKASLDVYYKKTHLLLDFFEEQNILITINSN